MALPVLSRPKNAFTKLVEFSLEQFTGGQADESLAAKYDSEDGIVAFVREVLQVARIRPYQERLLRKFYRTRRLAVRAPHSAGKCIPYSEPIQLADGSLVPAYQLIGKSFKVRSVNEKLDQRISQAFAWDNGIRDVIKITTEKGRSITRTLNHPLWCEPNPRGHGENRLRPDMGRFVDAGNIQPDYVIAAVTQNPVKQAYAISDDEIKLCAYLLADGSLTSAVTFSQQDNIILLEFKEICQRLGCKVVHGRDFDYWVYASEGCKKNRNGTNINPILELTREWGIAGKNSYEKDFPAWVWQLDNRQLGLFLSRFYACDGWAHCGTIISNCSPHREIGVASVSLAMCNSIHRALLRLGIAGSLRSKKTTWTHLGEKREGIAYCVDVRDACNGLLFCEKVGIYGKEDAIIAVSRSWKSASRTRKWRNKGLPSGYSWEKVKSVEILRNQPTVAISVPGDETFVTDFVEHNTSFASWCILWVFTIFPDDVKIPCTASVWRQLTKFLFPEIKKWATKADWERVGLHLRLEREILDLSIKLPGKEVFAVASNVASAIEGAHASVLFYVLDEAKAIPDDIWDAVEGAFASGGESDEFITFLLAISTPGDTSGRFYDICSRKDGYEDWAVDHVTLAECIEAGQIGKEWVEQRKKQWGENSPVYQQRVLANFAADTKEQVIPLSWVEAAIERWKEFMESDTALPLGSMSFGLDPAWTGDDKSAMTYVIGNLVLWVEYFTHVDPMPLTGELVSAVRREYAKYTAAVKEHNKGLDPKNDGYIELVPLEAVPLGIDAIGIGAGVYSRAEELGYNAYAVKVSEKSDLTDMSGVETFVNLRSAIWWLVRDWLNPDNNLNLMLPPDDHLIADLTTPKWKYMSDGRIRVEPKDDIHKRLKRSTDGGDAVGAALFMKVRKRYAKVTIA